VNLRQNLSFFEKLQQLWPEPRKYGKNPSSLMSLRVARGVYNPEKERFHYYVAFKPALDPTMDERGANASYKIDVALSVTETGELADLAFTLPKPCCNNRTLQFLSGTDSASVVDERVFVTVPGLSGDSVFQAKASLELDGAGRIIGLEIN
jgi:hypothetical protein